ncbi:hypothetical protein ACFQJC_08015 [Haloferax namakaokahaiae]|uniref:Small CPxCG-related zinc finger protein n=1 Tax=Haloferax namakaokahaiae TaxID=1748331 RepID=A0ABD5ZDU1_9EURY
MVTDTHTGDTEHVHEATEEMELTECPECGEPIRGADDVVRGKSVPTIEGLRKRNVTIGVKQTDLFMCKSCGAVLGVRRPKPTD